MLLFTTLRKKNKRRLTWRKSQLQNLKITWFLFSPDSRDGLLFASLMTSGRPQALNHYCTSAFVIWDNVIGDSVSIHVGLLDHDHYRSCCCLFFFKSQIIFSAKCSFSFSYKETVNMDNVSNHDGITPFQFLIQFAYCTIASSLLLVSPQLQSLHKIRQSTNMPDVEMTYWSAQIICPFIYQEICPPL